MSTTVAGLSDCAEAAYTDANGGSEACWTATTGASGIRMLRWAKRSRCRGERVTSRMRPRHRGKLNNILGGESVIYNAVPGHVLRYIVKGSGGDVIDSGRVKPTGTVSHDEVYRLCEKLRDLGGWACDGGTVRYGRMYRCAAPGAAESADANIAQNANIRYHFDLRDNASLESSRLGARCITSGIPCRPITATSLT